MYRGRDVRICVVGDSFVAGVGDPDHLGWVGRVAARVHRAGLPLSVYNLGVRRQTSRDLLARWQFECEQRLPAGAEGRVAFSFGVNDTTEESGRPRVTPDDSTANLTRILAGALAAGWQPLMIGPLPVDDPQHNLRSAALGQNFRKICADLGVGYVDVFEQLLTHDVWRSEIRTGDGAHPGAGGYQALADLIEPHWLSWLAADR
jgi:lysophospholipase L1-like esterase